MRKGEKMGGTVRGSKMREDRITSSSDLRARM